MPILLDREIPCVKELREENLIINIGENIGTDKDNTLTVVVVNLMPNKIETEKQLLKVLGRSPLTIRVKFLYLQTHQSKGTSLDYLKNNYETFDEIKKKPIDGMIITGAPLEHVEFKKVDYWQELEEIMDYASLHVRSTLFICWAAMAGLKHYYKIPKSLVEDKVFGVFPHSFINNCKLFTQWNDDFMVPHSRYFELNKKEIEKINNLEILAESTEGGVCVVGSKDGKQVYMAGHLEYDETALKREFERDVEKGIDIQLPKNYFVNNDPKKGVIETWNQYALKFFGNWIKYYVNNN